MSEPQWLVHLDDETRAFIHVALAQFCRTLSSKGPAGTLVNKSGQGGVILPRSVRAGHLRWGARINLLEPGLSLCAPPIRGSDRGSLHIVDWTHAPTSLHDVLPVVERWRDEIGSPDPERLAAARRNDARLRLTVRGCIELLYRPWRRAWIWIDPGGAHSLRVSLNGPPHELWFAARPHDASQDCMSAELVDVLDAIVCEGVHVYKPDKRDPGWMPLVRIEAGRSFYIDNDGELLEAMRAVRTVPTGASLVLRSP